jgi:hypothetical protein
LYVIGSHSVSILIISYNTREMTLACLRSVVEQTEPGTFEVIVVDNQSKDGSAGAIAADFPWVRLIRSSDNLGFAKANNVAAKEAVGDYLLLLNPDTLVLERAIDRLLEFARGRPAAGIWGGRTVFADGSLNPASCWQRQTLWSVFCVGSGLSSVFRGSGVFNPEALGGWDRSTVREVDIVSGCFLLIERQMWERLGGFDPAFFMYGEEADLCLRSHAMGCRPVVTPEATIVHYGGASERVRSDKMVRLLSAKVRLIRRHWSPVTRGVGVWMLAMWPLTRAVAWRAAAIVGPGSDGGTWGEVWRRRREWLAEEAPVTASIAGSSSTP